MRETEFSINPHSGVLVVWGADPALLTTLAAQLGHAVDLDCGQCPRPVSGQSASIEEEASGHVQVAGFVHQSMVDGPGLRSVLFMQGCHLRCSADCRNSYAHDSRRGAPMTVEAVLSELLRPDLPRDGITISGGEPFAQA
ncbi:MAG: 4Fe-4S cluster-binding domain-containing protein, partial [Dehalococcoidia bacterium]|nr:4Fe-4S cluster-binding domain-containing protein [Dehalococcoidia bacterium]